ncbi:nitrosoguanidine resistance protein [Grosmannia clavigera kw1407]|uniref:Nitrosoguanidine resistance protein n=1 Tax=Grosmannia clavigera (strain kw1407 / UAMH 11150) TaxID=655863 RepID=F0X743_GROCL|nr:nitrosoguanidine resistance protein [Grosmannia clavigera kw1407]EFX06623.1 nitrosoguanidine resistance protein [Grosmannia clavigera kw1407]
MALISWIVLNVTSILLPFELAPAFYRVGYIFPAHEVYQALLHIWSHGCNPQLHIALPVLFAWEIAAFVGSIFGVYRRSHYATLADEAQERELQSRIDAAMAFRNRRDASEEDLGLDSISTAPTRETRRRSRSSTTRAEELLFGPENTAGADGVAATLRQDLHRVMTREEDLFQTEQRRMGRACSFGPAFGLAFPPSHIGDIRSDTRAPQEDCADSEK